MYGTFLSILLKYNNRHALYYVIYTTQQYIVYNVFRLKEILCDYQPNLF